QLGHLTDARDDLKRATALAPRFAGGQLNLGFYYLLQGDFQKGLPLYEFRAQLPQQEYIRHFFQPRWTGGEILEGKTLLVYSEQGYGDIIQFCRYLAGLQTGHILFAAPKRLLRLLRSLSFAVTLCDIDNLPRQFDYQIPLMSLPLALNAQSDTIPSC